MTSFRTFGPEKKECDVGAAAITTGSTLLLGDAVELHSESAEACISDNNKATKRAGQ
jgi:hypothetical protein